MGSDTEPHRGGRFTKKYNVKNRALAEKVGCRITSRRCPTVAVGGPMPGIVSIDGKIRSLQPTIGVVT